MIGLILTFALGATSGVVMGASPGHFVGTAAAGGSILPLVGWSRTVGDLPVPHFLGLHAQQAIAIVGLLATGFSHGKTVVIVFALIDSLIVLGLFYQALAGHPFLPG